MTERDHLLDRLTVWIWSRTVGHPLRVAVDGPDTAGKTTVADELAELIATRDRPVIRASVDGFHRPRGERYASGVDSAEGYYRDSFDHDALRRMLLDPLGPEGDHRYRRAIFDHHKDEPVEERWEEAVRDSVLLFDGVFLLRPELRSSWDLSIYLHVGWDEVVRRAIARDAWMGSPGEVTRRYETRYIPGQKLYLAETRADEIADVAIDNSVPAAPELLRAPFSV